MRKRWLNILLDVLSVLIIIAVIIIMVWLKKR